MVSQVFSASVLKPIYSFQVDDVSLIPSVSNFLTSITNSAHTTDFLTRASAITAALSMIDWSAQFPQSCVDYKGCANRDIESCSDMLNQKDCERLTSDGGIFSPHDGCNWYQGAWNGSCYGEAVVCSTTRLEMDSECCDISIQTSPQTNMDRHNAFSRASEQLQGMIQHTKGLPKSPSSRFDVIGYLADELSQDWGEIGSRVVETLENIADYDWEAIFTTTNGSLYANQNAARVVAGLKFYRNLVVKVTEPLKGV